MAVHEFDCRSLPINKVTVFNDRAEINRLVAFELKEGTNEVHVTNVTNQTIHDSVRVDGRGGAVIHEVLLQDKPVVTAERDSPKIAEKRTEVQNKEGELNSVKDKKSVLEKRLEALDSIVGQVGSNVGSSDKGPYVINDTALDGLTKLFGFYNDTSINIREELRTTQRSIEQLEQEVQKARNELNELEYGGNNQYMKCIVVVLESESGGTAELDVIYQTYGASWSPKFDIRVETNEKTPNMEISYYGNVHQGTNEDWNDCPLVLSTAQPCLGGEIPELGTMEVSIRPPPPPPQPVQQQVGYGGGAGLFGARTCGAPMMMATCADTMEVECAAPRMFKRSIATVSDNVLNSEFTIERRKPIPSDGAQHKVTIGVINLQPSLIYECIPSKNTNAFLTACAVNTSEYPLLQGEAAVYLNKAFVTKTNLKNVSPNERFSCSLGVEAALRVEYKPVKKYHEQVGVISKSSSNVTEQLVVVKNTKNVAALLTLKEHIPRSTDERIKIRVVNPVIPASSADISEDSIPVEGVRLSSANNLEWTAKIPAQKSQEFLVKYILEHPKEEKVDFCEKF